MGSRAAALAAIAVVLAAVLAAGDPLDDRIAANEAIVRDLQGRATELYAGRQEVVPGCECSRHACDGEFDSSDICHEELGDSELCGDCAGQKVRRGRGPSAGKIAALRPRQVN